MNTFIKDNKIKIISGLSVVSFGFGLYFFRDSFKNYLQSEKENLSIDNENNIIDQTIEQNDLIDFYNEKIQELEKGIKEEKEKVELSKKQFEECETANVNANENEVFDKLQLENLRDVYIKRNKTLKKNETIFNKEIEECKVKIEETENNDSKELTNIIENNTDSIAL